MFFAQDSSVVLDTNCYVVGSSTSSSCVAIDPGGAMVGKVERILADSGRTLEAVLLTHGHIDHTLSAAGLKVPVYIHEADAYRLENPLAELGPTLRQLTQMFGAAMKWVKPAQVHTFTDGQILELAGLSFAAIHAPGHTEGSTLFRVRELPADGRALPGTTHTVFTGDVLFNQGIGRTDLSGGNEKLMGVTLRDVVLGLDDDAWVLPGHGPSTTLGTERARSPYLRFPFVAP